MATFIALLNFTGDGVKAAKESPARAQGNRDLAASMGVTVKKCFWTLGSYDVVMILDAADDETVTAFVLAMGAKGKVTSQTMRAFNAEEFAAIAAKMP
jgi:uncharacterized protein with GYD domain